jgi:hypothetical protein
VDGPARGHLPAALNSPAGVNRCRAAKLLFRFRSPASQPDHSGNQKLETHLGNGVTKVTSVPRVLSLPCEGVCIPCRNRHRQKKSTAYSMCKPFARLVRLVAKNERISFIFCKRNEGLMALKLPCCSTRVPGVNPASPSQVGVVIVRSRERECPSKR